MRLSACYAMTMYDTTYYPGNLVSYATAKTASLDHKNPYAVSLLITRDTATIAADIISELTPRALADEVIHHW